MTKKKKRQKRTTVDITLRRKPTRTPSKSGVNPGAPEGKVVRAILKFSTTVIEFFSCLVCAELIGINCAHFIYKHRNIT